MFTCVYIPEYLCSPYGIHRHAQNAVMGVNHDRAAGTSVQVKRVELAPTRHPLGSIIKTKVLNICEQLSHPAGSSASLDSIFEINELHLPALSTNCLCSVYGPYDTSCYLVGLFLGSSDVSDGEILLSIILCFFLCLPSVLPKRNSSSCSYNCVKVIVTSVEPLTF